MKYVAAIAIAVILMVTAYFVINPGERTSQPQVVRISNSNPFFAPQAVQIPYNTDKLQYAQKLFGDGDYPQVVSLCATLFSSEFSKKAKATLLLMAAQALVEINDADSRRYAREIYQVYQDQFASEGNLDTVHYNLGLLAVNEANGPAALSNFTTLLQEFPESRFASNAAFFARQIAGVIERS